MNYLMSGLLFNVGRVNASLQSLDRRDKVTPYLFKGTLKTHWRPSRLQFVQGGPFTFTSHRTFRLWQHSHDEFSARFRRLFGSPSPMMIRCDQMRIILVMRPDGGTRTMYKRATRATSRCSTSGRHEAGHPVARPRTRPALWPWPSATKHICLGYIRNFPF
jgi:hypothetical protein